MDRIGVLAEVPFLAVASAPALERLAAAGEIRAFARHEFLFHEGDPVEWTYLLVEGRVAATMTSPEGATVTAHIAGPGELCGRVDFLAGPVFTVSAHVLTAGTALALPATALRRVLETEPQCLLRFATDLAVVVTTLTTAVADLVFVDVTGRLARVLLDWADEAGSVALPGTQSELAARLGVTRQTLNTALARLAHDRLIRVDSPRLLHLSYVAALAKLARVSPR
ncbi:Crp/Fnr family transcriptional regulator [Agromyces protaetiae]|uniref:Crp/Fnr family transcriptional regulator n=1 Tax=Agromyces protaetiae TaxID=2509455 RepID=A0A4P6FCR4_9MICO|nr:Crp/Fnr family transcriptional regulator [Agromyces protaetiae]QAY73615.1 Crp/Fnr family transcriptional regulator [Agromyces protaetiae]